MYTRVSIPKASDNAGAPVPKNPTVIVIPADDIVTEPVRQKGNTVMTGDYALKADAKAIGLYATPTTISLTEESSGDADAKGVTKGVAFQHPGNSDTIKNFLEAFMNAGVVILVRDCDGSADGRCQAIGSKCNPLYLSTETTISNEATRRTLTFKQAMADAFMPGTYTGKLPDLAPETAAGGNAEEGA